MEEEEDVKFAEVNCLSADSEELCQEENTFLPDYPAFHIYKEEDIVDYFTDERYVMEFFLTYMNLAFEQ
jgi:hypothetical protein